ncbi:hypothetical protein O0Q50_28565 [Priestia aryabhattai]|uniref:Uncharacterized protein n=1 Tax=Priestia aryabhattai TaxID=412384 RepID=A0AAX6NI03_PRIAR|nr:hypothetical protein [Priestia aryabhattai]MDU9695155.1 hypothetical protein [Priestia aryabhattai]
MPVRLQTAQEHEVDLDAINRHTLEPVTADDIFTFSGVCSNDRLDSYFTRMDPVTTLRNYAADLNNGVSLLGNHNIYTAPFGRSYGGQLIQDDTDNANAVRGDWYILKGVKINGESTDDTIRAIKAGITRDMSVGFSDESYRCGSCGRDLWDWECPHIPGLEDENSRMSFAWIENARLREVSTVYKGATPGAYIDKARAYVQQGQLEENKIARLEQRFQTRFERKDGAAFFMPKREDNKNMNLIEQIRTALQKNEIEKSRVYEILQGEGEKFRQPDDMAIRNELGDQATVEGVKQLKVEAEQGRQYAADLVDQAVAERVRAQGDGFNAEAYKTMLVRAADLDYIKSEIESYKEMAGQRFTPGRHTNPDDPSRGHGGDPEDDIIVSESYKGDEK